MFRTFVGLALLATTARAVIFCSTDDPTHNTRPPGGSLAGSGWQWVGFWSGGQGAPIGPHHFLTAKHIGSGVGGVVRFEGVDHVVSAVADDPESDLRVCAVPEAFPDWAPLYRDTGEVGQRIVFFGTGCGRGEEVRVGDRVCGWKWGAGRGVLRWGENRIVRESKVPSWGPLLYAAFNPVLGPEVADLASGDSGAPVFLRDADGWKLAGIAAIVDGHVNFTDTGPGFDAALIDSRGLFAGSQSGWRRVSAPQPVCSGFYATRVSARIAWIEAALAAPLPPAPPPPGTAPVPVPAPASGQPPHAAPAEKDDTLPQITTPATVTKSRG